MEREVVVSKITPTDLLKKPLEIAKEVRKRVRRILTTALHPEFQIARTKLIVPLQMMDEENDDAPDTSTQKVLKTIYVTTEGSPQREYEESLMKAWKANFEERGIGVKKISRETAIGIGLTAGNILHENILRKHEGSEASGNNINRMASEISKDFSFSDYILIERQPHTLMAVGTAVVDEKKE